MTPQDLVAYVDGELDPEARERVERELVLHPEWIEVLSDFYRQRLLLAEHAREAMPAADAAPALADLPVEGRLPSRRRAILAAVLFAAAACLAVAVGVALFRGGDADRLPVKAPLVAEPGRSPGTGRVAEVRPGPSLPAPRPSPAAGPVSPKGPAPEPEARGERPASPAETRPPELPSPEPPPAAAKGPTAPPPAPSPEEGKIPPIEIRAVQTPAPAPKAVPSPTTILAARMESVSGKVQVLRGAGNKAAFPAAKGTEIRADDTIQVPAKGAAAIRYVDGSRLEAGPDTALTVTVHAGDARDAGAETGKKVVLQAGSLTVDAARQPPGLPLLLVTPHAEARVLGTRFTLTVEETSTRLEVQSGKVRLARGEGGAAVEVTDGQFAVAARDLPLEVKPMRAAKGLIALYRFREGRGNTVHDVSRAGAPLDLQIGNENAVSWIRGGLMVHDPTTVATPEPAAKIIQACQASRELTVEAWVKPLDREQGYVVSLLSNPYNLNFTLEQEGGDARAFAFHLRSARTGENGFALAVHGTAIPQRLAHVLYTRGVAGTGVLYVDGTRRGDHLVAGDFGRWEQNYRLALAGDAKGRRPWLGEFHLAAFYYRALSAAEVALNFRAGSE